MNHVSAFGRKFLGLMLAIALIFSMQTATVSAAPTQDIDVSFSAACSFEKDLNLVYNCKINTPGDFTNIRLRVSFQKFSDSTGSYTWENSEITDYTYDATTGKYRFEFKGICSDEMSNTVKCTLCANIGNQAYASQTKEFSVKQYAQKILEIYGSGTSAADKKLCTLMVDMLNYGAAAQKYFGRNTRNLANSGLTDAQKALATQLPSTFDSVQKVSPLSGSTASFKSVALSLLNTVDFIVYTAFTTTPGNNVVAELSYPTVEGGTAVVKKYLKDCEYDSGKDRYKIVFDAIPSLYFKTPFTVVIKDNGKQISPTLTYSYETYVKAIVEGNHTDEMKDLAKCMLAYGESANSYFEEVSGSGSGSGDITLTIDPGFENISTYKNSTYTKDLPKSVIVIPTNSTSEEQYAAGLVQTFIQREDGYQPQIITDATAQGSQGFEISVGLTNRPHGDLAYTEEDSYKIKSYTNGIALFGNGNRGTIDAAMKFLSVCGGYYWLSFEDGYRTNQSHFKYETNIDINHKRAFTFTDIDVLFGKTHEGENRLFSLANGLNGFYVNCTVKNQPGGDNWYLSKAAADAYGDLQPGQAHTLLSEYVTKDKFDEHPDWFSWYIEKLKDGTYIRERRPNQLCLSNPEVYEEIKKHVFEILESDSYDPTAPMQIISLSQADNAYYCMCDDCYAFRMAHERDDDKEGLCDAALYLDLCNRISAEVKAAGYTNVYIDMLAYTHNLKPPVNMTMDDHVIVRYAAISRCYAHNCDASADECLRNDEVIKHLQGWANLANTYGGQLWIWDYNANFADTTGPYMNLDMLCHDIKYYRDIGVSGIYLQSNDAHNSTNTEFGDLRIYLGAVLLENPDADTKKEMLFFLNEFYGDSAPYIYEAIKLMEEQAKNHSPGANADPYKYYWRGYCMTYDCPTSQVFANLYPTKMDAHNRMPQEKIELCEAYWNKALEVAANDTQRHLYVTGRSNLGWRWAKSCMGALEFEDLATYKDMNEQLYDDVYTTYKTRMYSLIIRSVPKKYYIDQTPDRWCNTNPWWYNPKYTHWQEEWENRGN